MSEKEPEVTYLSGANTSVSRDFPRPFPLVVKRLTQSLSVHSIPSCRQTGGYKVGPSTLSSSSYITAAWLQRCSFFR